MAPSAMVQARKRRAQQREQTKDSKKLKNDFRKSPNEIIQQQRYIPEEEEEEEEEEKEEEPKEIENNDRDSDDDEDNDSDKEKTSRTITMLDRKNKIILTCTLRMLHSLCFQEKYVLQ